jgi:hypothetical protein
MRELPAWGWTVVKWWGVTWITDRKVDMRERKLVNETINEDAGSDLAHQGGRAVAIEGKRRGSKAWLFGAYTFLILWGMAYLVLFFTDRLPF